MARATTFEERWRRERAIRAMRSARQQALAEFRGADTAAPDTDDARVRSIAEILPAVLDELTRLQFKDPTDVWEAAAGKDVAAWAKPVGVKKGTLLIVTPSAAHSYSLRMLSAQITEKLRQLSNGEIQRFSFRFQ